MGDREFRSAIRLMLKKQEAACAEAARLAMAATEALAKAKSIFDALSVETARASLFVSEKKSGGWTAAEIVNADKYLELLRRVGESAGSSLSVARDKHALAMRESSAAMHEKKRLEGIAEMIGKRMAKNMEREERKVTEDTVSSMMQARAAKDAISERNDHSDLMGKSE